jgi:hypothetical protein
MCIWNALHQNPRPGNDIESKMRGWTGTELGNKVSDTFLSQKKKEAGGVVFTVKQDDARNKDVQDFQFTISDAAGNLGIPRIVGDSTIARVQDAIDKEQGMMEAATIGVLKEIIFPPKTEYITKILRILKDKLHIGETKAKAYFNDVREKYPSLLYQTKDGKFTISKKEYEAYENGLPFASEP